MAGATSGVNIPGGNTEVKLGTKFNPGGSKLFGPSPAGNKLLGPAKELKNGKRLKPVTGNNPKFDPGPVKEKGVIPGKNKKLFPAVCRKIEPGGTMVLVP